jgi:hypothetical protein
VALRDTTMFNTSVSDILKVFNKTVAKLEAHAKKHDIKAAKESLKIQKASQRQLRSVHEVTKAVNVSNKIRALIEV